MDEIRFVSGHIGRSADEFDAIIVACAKLQFVVERDGLKDGAQFVVAVRSAAEDAQAQVDLAVGRQREAVDLKCSGQNLSG